MYTYTFTTYMCSGSSSKDVILLSNFMLVGAWKPWFQARALDVPQQNFPKMASDGKLLFEETHKIGLFEGYLLNWQEKAACR